MVEGFDRRGWLRTQVDPAVLAWAAAARAAARRALADPAMRARWLVCEGTWFVGVDALPNGPDGAVDGGAALGGAPVAALETLYGPLPPLHAGQVSVVWPGYPRPRAGEGEGAFRYRARRDAAHVDGLRAIGPDRRRMLREPHAFILGLPLSEAAPEAAPLVVWEGSHEIMRARLGAVLRRHPPEAWPEVDLTGTYQAARREVFETCARIPLPARPGEATILHRLALHGVAPWAGPAPAHDDGRMIAYFRPLLQNSLTDWLETR